MRPSLQISGNSNGRGDRGPLYSKFTASEKLPQLAAAGGSLGLIAEAAGLEAVTLLLFPQGLLAMPSIDELTTDLWA